MKTTVTVCLDPDVKEKSMEYLQRKKSSLSYFLNESLKNLLRSKSIKFKKEVNKTK